MPGAGVQHLPLRPGNVLAAVDRIGQQRMTQAGHMHADLVGAAGFQAAHHFGDAAARVHLAAARWRVIGNGGFGCHGTLNAHADRHAGIAADGAFDTAAGRAPAMPHRPVFPTHAPRLK
ncbi:hypothetical protein G6F57_023142 [Rhizopus arrhizus]|nr:hypothetical protein G6F57_023142 [Rhizopus arrhizus]